MNAIVQKFLLNKQFDSAHVYADYLSEPQRSNNLQKIIDVCVEKGLLDNAELSAKAIGRALTTVELNKILSFNVFMGNFNEAQNVATRLGEKLGVEELKAILFTCMKNQQYDHALNAIELLPKKQRVKLAKTIRLKAMANMNYQLAKRAAEVQGVELTEGEKQKIADAHLTKTRGYQTLKIIVSMSGHQRKDYLELLLSAFVKQGELVMAQETAEHLGRILSVDELKTIIVAQCGFSSANQIKEALQPLSASNRIKVIQKYVNDCLDAGDCDYEQISRLAHLLPEKSSNSLLKKIFKQCVIEGNLDRIRYLSIDLKIELTVNQLKIIIKSLLAHDDISTAHHACTHYLARTYKPVRKAKVK